MLNVPHWSAGAAYLVVDGPDVSETMKVPAHTMRSFREGHDGFEVAVRNLARSRRKAIVYMRQAAKDAQLEMLVDSDWASHSLRQSSTLHGGI